MIFSILGGAIVFYLIYIFFALIFKHKVGLIIASILSLAGGVLTTIASGAFFLLLSSVVGAIIVYFVQALHIRDANKKKK